MKFIVPLLFACVLLDEGYPLGNSDEAYYQAEIELCQQMDHLTSEQAKATMPSRSAIYVGEENAVWKSLQAEILKLYEENMPYLQDSICTESFYDLKKELLGVHADMNQFDLLSQELTSAYSKEVQFQEAHREVLEERILSQKTQREIKEERTLSQKAKKELHEAKETLLYVCESIAEQTHKEGPKTRLTRITSLLELWIEIREHLASTLAEHPLRYEAVERNTAEALRMMADILYLRGTGILHN